MKRLTSVAVAVGLVVGAASTAWAGQEIYVGVVGQDDLMKRYYLEEKLHRWLHPEQTSTQEAFWSRNTSRNIEVCINEEGFLDEELWESKTVPPDATVNEQLTYALNYHLSHNNAGEFHWKINLPKKPRGNINIQLQCGVLKPNAFTREGMPGAIDYCAGETGEKSSDCNRIPTFPNEQHIFQGTLPTVTARVHSTNAAFAGEPGGTFPLTAYRVPSAFSNIFTAGGELKGFSKNLQVLDGSKSTRVVLKSCQPETIFVKMPIDGQMVAAKDDEGNVTVHREYDLEAGDEIELTLAFPRDHTMDVYCNQWSAKIMGLGEPDTEDDVEVGL
jgi:hypothetical protein